jgi:hypothetical protein
MTGPQGVSVESFRGTELNEQLERCIVHLARIADSLEQVADRIEIVNLEVLK